MQKGFTTLQKSLLVLIVFGTLVLGILAFTTKAGTSIGITLGLTSAPGGIENGLVGHWTFDGDNMPSGQVNDRSGSGYHGSMKNTATSSIYAAGAVGQGLNFDGVDDGIVLAGTNLGRNATHGTISAWIKRDVNGSLDPILDINTALGGDRFQLAVDSSNRARIISRSDDSEAVSSMTIASPTIVKESGWVHLVGTIDYANDRMEIFINGKSEGVGAATYGQNSSSDTAPTVVNLGFDAGSGFFDGMIDDVRVYTRVLTVDEIKHLYQLGATTRIAATPSQPPTKTGLNNGLVGHWTFDGKDMPSGQVNDISGSGNHGSLRSAATTTVYTVGSIGQALKFDGVDDYVELPLSVATNAVADEVYSYATWVYIDDFANTQIIMSATDLNGLGDPNTILEFNYDSATGFFGASAGAADANLVQYNPSNIPGWYHLGAVANGSSFVMYVNGVAVGTDSAVSAVSGLSPLSFSIGRPESATRFHRGKVDDVRIYTRALSADEMNQLYQLGATTRIATTPSQPPTKTGLNAGLVGHWTFDGKNMPSGQVNDLSGNSNHGSQRNMSTTSAYTQGAIGQALQFDGSDDDVHFGDQDVFSPVTTGFFTVSIWVRPDSIAAPDATEQGIFTKMGGSNNEWQIRLQNSGTLQWTVLGNDNSTLCADSSTNLVVNKWQHLVGVYDGIGCTLYIDTISQGIDLNGGTGVLQSNGTSAVVVGRRSSGIRPYKGALDDARIYNRVLSLDEIRQLYQMGN